MYAPAVGWLIAVALLLPGGCPTVTPPAEETKLPTLRLSARQVDVPLQMVGTQAFVDVWIDGAGPFAFLLDTGASDTFVAYHLATQFPGQIIESERTIADTDGTRIRAGFELAIGALELGPAEVTDLQAGILDLSHLSAALQTPVDGILGFPLFEHASMEIDYGAARLRLSADSLLDPGAGTVMPFVQKNSRPYLTMHIGQQQVSALVDTGNTLALHLPGELEGVGYSAGPRQWYDGADLSGVTTAEIARLQAPVQVGAAVLPAPVVVLGEISEPIIGAGFLRDYIVRFDTPSGQMQLVPQSAAGADDGVRTFGFRYTVLDGQPVITGVLAGGPAEAAGVQTGDTIVGVNQTRLDGLGDDGAWFGTLLLATHTNPANRAVDLALLRADAAPYEVTLESVAWIP